MGKRVNPAFVGAFVLGAIGLIVVAVVLFGSGKIFSRTHEYVVYFSGDVNGLRPGAAVKFKGVEIGQVSRIRLRLEQQMSEKTGVLRADARIPVIIALDEEKLVSHGGGALDLNDPRTIPTLIQEGLRYLMRGRTTFVIAHRLSTIRRADQILVVEQGEIVERGTHESLYELHGRYYDLYTRQHGLETNLFLAPGEGDKVEDLSTAKV